MRVVSRVSHIDSILGIRFTARDLYHISTDRDLTAVHISDGVLLEDGGIVGHASVGRQAGRFRHRVRTDVVDGHQRGVLGIILRCSPALENLSFRNRSRAGIVDNLLDFRRSICRLDIHRRNSLLAVDEVDCQSWNDSLYDDIHRELIRIEQSARSSDGRITVYQGAFAVAVDVHDAALVLGRIDRLLGRADQHPHRFAVGRLDLFPVIFKGDVHRGYILGLDGVVLHGVLYGIDDVLRIDGLDFHRRSLGEDVLVRPDGHADAADLVEERHGRHAYGRRRLFLRGLIVSLFRGFLRQFGRLLRGDLLRNTRRLLCGFFRRCLCRSLRRFLRGFLRRTLHRLFSGLCLGCRGLFGICGSDLCRLLCRSFRDLSRRLFGRNLRKFYFKLFRRDLREFYFKFFRSVSFLQCRLIGNLDLHRRSDGRQSRAEEQHQSQEHAEKSLKGRPGPTVPRTLHVCFLLFPADAMRSC